MASSSIAHRYEYQTAVVSLVERRTVGRVAPWLTASELNELRDWYAAGAEPEEFVAHILAGETDEPCERNAEDAGTHYRSRQDVADITNAGRLHLLP